MHIRKTLKQTAAASAGAERSILELKMSKISKYSRVSAFYLAVGGATWGCGAGPAEAQAPMRPVAGAEGELRGLLERYEEGLNAGNVDGILELYATAGVFMAQHREPAVGRVAIRQAYEEVFQQIRLNIDFEFDEIVQLSETRAYARTRSRGTVEPVGTALKLSESNQEFFLLERESTGEPWLIARYIFSTMNPPAAPCPAPAGSEVSE